MKWTVRHLGAPVPEARPGVGAPQDLRLTYIPTVLRKGTTILQV